MVAINDRIIAIAEHYGLDKPADFARKTGFSHQVASNYLKGLKKPSVDALEKIQLCFDEISPLWLITGKGEMLKKSNGYVNKIDTDSIETNEHQEVYERPVEDPLYMTKFYYQLYTESRENYDKLISLYNELAEEYNKLAEIANVKIKSTKIA